MSQLTDKYGDVYVLAQNLGRRFELVLAQRNAVHGFAQKQPNAQEVGGLHKKSD